jgi:hypothetical protein
MWQEQGGASVSPWLFKLFIAQFFGSFESITSCFLAFSHVGNDPLTGIAKKG